MSFAAEIVRQARQANRPANSADLLIHPIANDPTVVGAVSDPGWVEQHVAQPRFYVGGVPWFLELTLLNAEKLSYWKDEAAAKAKNVRWPDMPGVPRNVVSALQAQWGAIARQQYFRAAALRAVTFPKAALFLLSCELALDDLIKKRATDDRNPAAPRLPKNIVSGEAIYQRMAIIPACWNINDFNTEFINQQLASMPTFLQDLAAHTNQSDPKVFQELAAGHTITFALANGIASFCQAKNRGPLGQVRCRAGRNLLGSRRAAEFEELRP